MGKLTDDAPRVKIPIGRELLLDIIDFYNERRADLGFMTRYVPIRSNDGVMTMKEKLLPPHADPRKDCERFGTKDRPRLIDPHTWR